jgi:hypothetical protein
VVDKLADYKLPVCFFLNDKEQCNTGQSIFRRKKERKNTGNHHIGDRQLKRQRKREATQIKIRNCQEVILYVHMFQYFSYIFL